MALSSLDPLGLVSLLYQGMQLILAWLFAPLPPHAHAHVQKPLGRVAVIGAGITGVSSAAHLVGHGFDVTLFEAGDRSNLGGIWANVNSSSGLQISSLMYRFHPLVRWTKGYPKKQEILDNVTRVWETYELEEKTHFNVSGAGRDWSCLVLMPCDRPRSLPSRGTAAPAIPKSADTDAGSSTTTTASCTTASLSASARAASPSGCSCPDRTSSRARSSTPASSTTSS
jgi:hypothetical protein